MCEWDVVKLLEVDEVSPSLPVLWPTVVEHRFTLQERSSQPSNTRDTSRSKDPKCLQTAIVQQEQLRLPCASPSGQLFFFLFFINIINFKS